MSLLEKYVTTKEEVVFKEIESSGVLLNLESGSYYTLNKTGALVYSFIDGKLNLKQIANRLVDLFRLDPTEAEKDVEALIVHLKSEGLVELQDESR
jgi:hypothetical protein